MSDDDTGQRANLPATRPKSTSLESPTTLLQAVQRRGGYVVVGGAPEDVVDLLALQEESHCELLSNRSAAERIAQAANQRFRNAPKTHIVRNLSADILEFSDIRTDVLLLIDGATFIDHLKHSSDKLVRMLDMLSGYATPQHVILAGVVDEISAALAHSADLARRPIALHDPLSVITIDRFEIGRIAFDAPDDQTLAELRKYSVGAPEAGIQEHAAFIAQSTLNDLVVLHRSLPTHVAHAAYSYWRNAFARMQADVTPSDTAQRAIDKLNELQETIDD